MTLMEERSLKFIKELQESFFEGSDMVKMLSFLDENVVWIDIGESRGLCGISQVRSSIESGRSIFGKDYQVLEYSYDVTSLDEFHCLLQGEIIVRKRMGDRSPMASVLRVSAVTQMIFQELKVKMCHLSFPDSQVLAESALLYDSTEGQPPILEDRIEALKRMLREQSLSLEEKIRDLDMLTNNLPGGVICCEAGPTLKLLHYSDGFLKMFGYTREEIQSKYQNDFIHIIHPEDYRRNEVLLQQQLSKGPTKEIQYRVRCKDGNYVWVMDRGQLVESEHGERLYYCILMDITEEKNARDELRLSLERHKIILDQTTDIIFEWDIKKDTLYFSNNWKKKFGYQPIEDHISKRLLMESKIHPEDTEKVRVIMEEMRLGKPYSETEFRILEKEERYLWFRIRATLQLDAEGKPAKAVGVIVDINADKIFTEKLQKKAERDGLTGVYNKITAESLFKQYITEAKADSHCALLIIDIDDFKKVNDSIGHMGGDIILRQTAAILTRMFRSDDIIGRIGGDEFMVLMRNIPSAVSIEKKVNELMTAFETLMREHESERLVTCSIGISIAPQDGSSFHELYMYADQAMYEAKTQGKNRFVFYHK